MDVEDIQPGQNFAQRIEGTLTSCSHVLAVIGPRWHEILEARAKQQNTDYVVHEIAAALQQKKTVVPVFVAGATVASLTALPAELAELSFHQAIELHDSSFNDDCDRLAKTLHLTPPGLMNRLRWLAAALVLVLVLFALFAAQAGLGPWRASHQRKLQIAQLLKTADGQVQQAEYPAAFQSYQQVLDLSATDQTALNGQVDAALLWLENFHALAPEGQSPADIAAPLLAKISDVLDAGLARTSGKNTRAADIVAHQGWLHWLNQKIAAKEFDNAERYFAQALAIDPANVYAHAFYGNWLLQTNGDTTQALKHFESALAAHSHTDLVRRMQLGGLYHNDAPGMRAEFVKALNQVRVNHETLEQDLRDRVSYLYSPTVSNANELRETLTAVPPGDAWQTFVWLNPPKPGMAGEKPLADFIHANLTEISGNREAALTEFKALANRLKAMDAGGSLSDYTTAAIRRLSKP